jgi:VanZ family protein
MPSNILPALPHDKLQHFASFLALGILGFGWVSTRSSIMFVALAALGGAIELVQPLPLFGRDGDVLDWLADLTGIAAAFAIVTIAHELGRRPKLPN